MSACLYSCTRQPITEQALACLTRWQAPGDHDAHVLEWIRFRRSKRGATVSSGTMRLLLAMSIATIASKGSP